MGVAFFRSQSVFICSGAAWPSGNSPVSEAGVPGVNSDAAHGLG